MAKAKTSSPEPLKKTPPARTPEGREQQLAAYAMDLVEKRLLEGTASSQETTHFLKATSTKTKLENEILELQRELVKAKTEALRAEKNREEMFTKAINAMKIYGGHGGGIDDDEEDEY